MFQGFQNIPKIPELKRRIIITLLLLAVYRIGVHVPTPGIDAAALAAFFAQAKGTLFSFIDMFSGGAFERLSVFALGIMPYISSSIILQLLTVVVPHLERLSKEGEAGRKKITQYTRYGTVILSLIQGFGISVGLERMTGPRGRAGGPGPGMVFPLDDHDYPHRGNGFYHVAGRADHGAGHRERNFPDYFRRHRGPDADRHQQQHPPAAYRGDGDHHHPLPDRP